MHSWTEFEERVLAWITDGMPFAAYPPAYKTNVRLELESLNVVHTDQPIHLSPLLNSLHKNSELAALYLGTLLSSKARGEAKEVRQALGGDLAEIATLCQQVYAKTGKVLGHQAAGDQKDEGSLPSGTPQKPEAEDGPPRAGS